MASERKPFFDYAVLFLLLVNIAITSYSVLRPNRGGGDHSEKQQVNISEAQAVSLANEVVKLYNQKDSAAFYAKFDSLAKAQLTQEQLSEQMVRLYPVIGSISDAAFSSATLAGSDGGRDYYALSYKVRLSGGPFANGDMKLTVTPRENGLGLVGFFVNGTSQGSQQ